MLMGMFMKGHGKMIKLKGLEFTIVLMDRNMRVNGTRINKPEKAWRYGRMGPVISDSTMVVKNTAQGINLWLMDQSIQDIIQMIIFTVMELINDPMEENMQVIGRTIKCNKYYSFIGTGRENSHGLTEENMLGSIQKTRNMVRGSLAGQMIENIVECGLTVNSMVREFTRTQQVMKKKENGMKGKE